MTLPTWNPRPRRARAARGRLRQARNADTAAPVAAGERPPRVRGAGEHLPPGIDWFAGDVDAAFAAAKAANKPVFLYWGAEWCPPCAQIKSTIFSKREFQERSRLFVPVYLDGDTPSAQKHGERFGVVGYPTMILFKPGRHRDHAAAGRRRHRAVRDDPRRRAGRCATGERDSRRRRPRRPGHGQRLEAARVLLLGHRQRPRAAARAATARPFRAGTSAARPSCPASAHGSCSITSARRPTRRSRTSRRWTGWRAPTHRRQLLALLPLPSVQAANVDNLLYGPQGRRSACCRTRARRSVQN